MNAKQIGLSVVLADFVALTAYAIYQYGYVGFFAMATANAVSVQLLVDVVIAFSLFSVWMLRDAREHGISPLPYLLLVLTLGSIGALAYLIRRSANASVPAVAARARQQFAATGS